jgi:hypothetical protein
LAWQRNGKRVPVSQPRDEQSILGIVSRLTVATNKESKTGLIGAPRWNIVQLSEKPHER